MTDYINEIKETLKELVSYNTILGEGKKNAPFGEVNKACLTRTLEIGRELGFSTKDVDGYAGHIEFSGKDGLVGILGHLDIVPAGEGWNFDPFACEENGGYMYGRGVLDDKGPVVICLYAMKKLLDEGFKPHKSIRLIMGCNEENGSTCVEHYFTKEQMPDVGFSPDGDFPIIHCEKGIVWVGMKIPTNLIHFSNLSGGDKTNMVAQKATAVYQGNLDSEYFASRGFKVAKCEKCGGLIITAQGKSAHGSTPDKGENAIWKLVKLIKEIENDQGINYIYNKFCLDTDGKNSGLKCEDEKSGALTQNFGTLKQTGNTLELSVDVRYPNATSVKEIFAKIMESAPLTTEIFSINEQAALFVDPDGELVQSLLGIYRKYTGSNSPSLIIGGGTYAREMKNGVAFGPMFEDEEASIHMPNEKIKVENIEKLFNIYYEAIKTLAK